MIAGTFGDEDELFFEIDLIAADDLELPVEYPKTENFFCFWKTNEDNRKIGV